MTASPTATAAKATTQPIGADCRRLRPGLRFGRLAAPRAPTVRDRGFGADRVAPVRVRAEAGGFDPAGRRPLFPFADVTTRPP
ncbi:hypothetical protein ASF68_17120 [Plantibacter sp. Leaf314]|nr:hypothetical protein ASF68_17120 [Plantibacter sp. Leaf314]